MAALPSWWASVQTAWPLSTGAVVTAARKLASWRRGLVVRSARNLAAGKEPMGGWAAFAPEAQGVEAMGAAGSLRGRFFSGVCDAVEVEVESEDRDEQVALVLGVLGWVQGGGVVAHVEGRV